MEKYVKLSLNHHKIPTLSVSLKPDTKEVQPVKTAYLQKLARVFEPPRDKPTKWVCTQWRLWSAWTSAWRKLGFLITNWAHSEDSDQTGRMPRLIWVYAWRTVTLLVLSCRGSFESVDVTTIGIILYRQRITKALIRLWMCRLIALVV